VASSPLVEFPSGGFPQSDGKEGFKLIFLGFLSSLIPLLPLQVVAREFPFFYYRDGGPTPSPWSFKAFTFSSPFFLAVPSSTYSFDVF